MNILYLLIPIGLAFIAAAIWFLFWAVKSGQYDDSYTPSVRMLFEDELVSSNSENNNQNKSQTK